MDHAASGREQSIGRKCRSPHTHLAARRLYHRAIAARTRAVRTSRGLSSTESPWLHLPFRLPRLDSAEALEQGIGPSCNCRRRRLRASFGTKLAELLTPLVTLAASHRRKAR